MIKFTKLCLHVKSTLKIRQYDTRMYILTTPTHKLEGGYIRKSGKSHKTDEHEVVYYCGYLDKSSMKLAE